MKKLRDQVAVASLALVGSIFNLGCERHSASEQYYLIAANIGLPYWKTANSGLQAAAARYGVKAEMRGPYTLDAKAEADELDAMIARHPAGILVSAADPKLMQPEIDKALGAGIPVITMDSDVPDSQRLYFVGTNNLQAGRLGGQRLVQKLNGKGNVVFFTIQGQLNAEERLKGYKDVLADHPGIKVADVFDMHGDSGAAMDKASEYLGRKGADAVSAFVCLEASAGKDIAEAFKRNNVKDKLLVAMDTDQATLDLIKDGTIDSSIAQKPYTMAFFGLKGLDDVHHYPPTEKLTVDFDLESNSPFPSFVDTGVALVDSTNVDSFLKSKPTQ
ncbi:ABC sugar transporter, periplasmic ligand binding protein [Acidisarcina polymorpha]|uniref:ABC sugar transporter, periplasmic ligand binding protein n=1 Tax=Acidisarcina polymorpha TaxID=2211140 RepID=A0A2Z5G6N0_9BACT|nr:substrate-binding domain-containing protein [Acidisarcina polymorpha]AXC14447.1 ABC sugar transporter, periplasmic ligand binding protein [Acidisarcina polymorpha]